MWYHGHWQIGTNLADKHASAILVPNLKIEIASSYKVLLYTYQTTRRQIRKDRNVHNHWHEKLKSRKVVGVLTIGETSGSEFLTAFIIGWRGKWKWVQVGLLGPQNLSFCRKLQFCVSRDDITASIMCKNLQEIKRTLLFNNIFEMDTGTLLLEINRRERLGLVPSLWKRGAISPCLHGVLLS